MNLLIQSKPSKYLDVPILIIINLLVFLTAVLTIHFFLLFPLFNRLLEVQIRCFPFALQLFFLFKHPLLHLFFLFDELLFLFQPESLFLSLLL
mmetsp:Transcript_33908/g.33013  ORF Transcript_33908/g.33013 Transcript_33908/m.33013 type:complete len:93 (-) Transcript_33908:289-567(-)